MFLRDLKRSRCTLLENTFVNKCNYLKILQVTTKQKAQHPSPEQVDIFVYEW